MFQPIHLTEDEIFSSPVVYPPAGGEGVGVDGAEEYPFVLQWDIDSPESEVLQTLVMNSVNGVDVHSEAIHQQILQPASSDAQQVDIPSDPAYVTHSVHIWPNEGLDQVVQECARRPRQRRAASSSSNATPQPHTFPHQPQPDIRTQSQKISPPLRRRSASTVQPDAERKPIVRRRRRLERANPVVKVYEHLAALPTNATTQLLHYFPSMLKHPFQLPSTSAVTRPNMFAVINSSDVPRAAALVREQVAAPSLAPDHVSEPIPSSAPAQFFVNPQPKLIDPALMGFSTAPVVDSTATTTTRIDPLQALQALAEVHGPLSSDSECHLINYPSSSSDLSMHQVDLWGPNSFDSPLFPEQAPEPALDQVPEQAVIDEAYFVSQPATSISSPLFPTEAPQSEQQQQAGTAAPGAGSPVHFVVGTREHSMIVGGAKNGRLRWTAALHDKFVAAVASLGGPEKATPKAVLRVMACPEINIYHVKSHLQKFRLLPVAPESPKCSKRQRHERGLEAAATTEHITKDLDENAELQEEMQARLHKTLETTKDLERRIDQQSARLRQMLAAQQAQSEAAGLITTTTLQAITAESADTASLLAQPNMSPEPQQVCNLVQVPNLVIVPNRYFYPSDADIPDTMTIAESQARGGESAESPRGEYSLELWTER